MGLRILFAGLPEFANALADAGHVPACICLPFLDEDDDTWTLLARASASGVPVLPGEALTADATRVQRRTVERAGPYDLVLTMHFDRRVEPWALALGARGAWNVHPSLLPRLRGYNPYFWTIRRNERFTGLTVHHLVQRFDAGDVVARVRLPVPRGATSGQLHEMLHARTMPLLLPLLDRLAAGRKVPRRPQVHARATLAPRPREVDLRVDLRQDAEDVVTLIRAATPEPGALLELAGRSFVVTGAQAGPRPPRGAGPGSLFHAGEHVFVAAGRGSFRPLLMRRPSGVVRLADLVAGGAA